MMIGRKLTTNEIEQLSRVAELWYILIAGAGQQIMYGDQLKNGGSPYWDLIMKDAKAFRTITEDKLDELNEVL